MSVPFTVIVDRENAMALVRFEIAAETVLASFEQGSLSQRRALRLLGLGQVRVVQGEPELGVRDARPVELGELGGLGRVGIGHRQGVAAASVEGVLEVQDAIGSGLYPVLLVEPGLPVERRLHGVLDCQGPSSHEEQIPEFIRNGDLAERTDE